MTFKSTITSKHFVLSAYLYNNVVMTSLSCYFNNESIYKTKENFVNIVIIGNGPAGNTVASKLNAKGLNVKLLLMKMLIFTVELNYQVV